MKTSSGWGSAILRVARARLGLTQRELAAAAGVPQSSIAKIESGTRSPSFETVDRILQSVGLELRVRIEPRDDHDHVLAALAARDPQRSERLLQQAHDLFGRAESTSDGA